MSENFLKVLDELHENEKHEEIVKEIEEIDKKYLDSELLGRLARAYNNLSQFDKALEILKGLEKFEKDTSLWNYRIAYTYFHLEKLKEAEKHFKKALEINPGEEDCIYFLMRIYDINSNNSTDNENFLEAIEWANKGLELAKASNIKEEIIFFYSRLGWLLDYIGEYEKASDYLKEVIDSGVDDIWTYSEYSFSQIRMGNYNKGIEFANKAIKLGRNDSWIYSELGYAYSKIRDFEKALEYLQLAKENNEDSEIANNVYIENEYGYVLVELERYEEAIKHFENLLKNKIFANDDKIFSLSQLAYAYRIMNDFNKALKYCLEANKLGRDDAWLNVEIALNYSAIEDDENSLKYWQKAHEIDSDNSFITYQMAISLRNLRKFEEALKILLDLFEKDSEDIVLNSEIGWIYNELENFEEAYKYLEKAEKLGRNDEWLFSEMGQCLARMERYEEAIDKLKMVLDIPNVSLDEKIFANSELGWIYNRMDQREEALGYLFKAKELGRDDIFLNSEIGWALVDFPDKYEEAEKHFKKAMELGRDDEWIYCQLGYLYTLQNRYEEAVEYLKKSDELLPYQSWTSYYLGISLRELGKIEEAIDVLTKAYEFSDYSGWFDLQLAWSYALIANKNKAEEYLANVEKSMSAELEADEKSKNIYNTIKEILNSLSYLS